MRFLLLFVLAVGLVSITSVYMIGEPGYALIRWSDWQIETSLAFLAAGAAALLLAVYLGIAIVALVLRMPRRFSRSYRKYQEQKTLRATVQAFQHLILGEWTKAIKQFDSAARKLPEPVISYLAAAYACQQSEDAAGSKRYMQQAKAAGRNHEPAVALVDARLKIKRGEYAEAVEDLRALVAKLPSNPTVLRALSDAYRQTGQWRELRQLLPHLKKAEAFSPSELERLSVQLLGRRLASAASASELMTVWNEASNANRLDHEVTSIYVRQLLVYDKHQEAEKITRKTLDKNWSTQLAYLYGLVGGEMDNQKLYDTAVKWAQAHGDDVNLMLTIGRLARRLKLWGIAQSSCEKAIASGAGGEASELLGRLLESQGRVDEALQIYKQGLTGTQAVRSELPALGELGR